MKTHVGLTLPPVRDQDGDLWHVVLGLGDGSQPPVLTLSRKTGAAVARADYPLAAFLRSAAFSMEFRFGGPGCSESPRSLSWPMTAQLARSAMEHVSSRLGAFEIVWRQADEQVPF